MTEPDQAGHASYRSAGVDIDAGDRAVELMAQRVRRASRPEVVGGLGGFAGLFDASALTRFRRPLLASATDGVGTKLAIAQALDVHDTVGLDLVAMVVDDLVVCGAEPLFLLDYVACGRVVPERMAAVVEGIAEGCVQAGAALLGGETAEHPGVMAPDAYDLAATGVGVVEADATLGPERVLPGDVVIAMAASGLHANGFSLVRHVLLDRAGLSLAEPVPELDDPRPLGEVLLTPTRIYARDCLALYAAAGPGLHALAHITGGGLAANLARVLPTGCDAVLDRATWAPPAVFRLLGDRGQVPGVELERTVNMGVGMVAVVGPEAAADTLATLADRGVPAWELGAVRAGSGDAALLGEYAGGR